MKVALHMIVSGSENPDSLRAALNSVKDKVDASYVLITTPLKDEKLKSVALEMGAVVDYQPDKFTHTVTQKEREVLQKFKIDPIVKKGDKVFLFDKARNASMDMVPKRYSWLFWLDSDDVYQGQDLRKEVENAVKHNADSVFMNYIYDAEIENGKVKQILIEHLRERLIKNDGSYKWIAPIHETLIEQRPTKKIDTRTGGVLHLSSHKRRNDALMRNIKTLEWSVASTNASDPRPIYYLGKAYFDVFLVNHNKDFLLASKRLFEEYLDGEHKSGWSEERSQCYEYLVEVYRELGQFDNAIKCAHHAMIEDERFPSIYINLALCYVVKGEFNRALFWINLASRLDQPQTTLVASPKELMTRSMEVIYHAALNTSKLDMAFNAAKSLLQLDPNKPEYAERYNLLVDLKDKRDITKVMVTLIKYLEQHREAHKLKPLAQAIPNSIKDNPFMADFIQQVNPPRVWSKDEICLYCGPAFTPWSPKQLDNPGTSFVGGSEEAVICLAKELQQQGWKVTVYADPGSDVGEYDGVKYEPYFNFNPKDEFNIVVSWRRPDLVDQNLKAKKIYIWCHDIQNQLDYTQERLEKITKIILLSPFHRSNLPDIPDNKIMISRNGIL